MSAEIPRTVEELVKKGRYSMREIAYTLNIISKDDPTTVTAFDEQSPTERAEVILEAIAQLEKEKAKKEKAAPAKRSPRVTKGTGRKRRASKEPEAEEAEQEEAPAQPAAPSKKIDEIGSLKADISDLGAGLGELHTKIDYLTEALVRMARASMYINAIVAEQILEVDVGDVLKDAFDNVHRVERADEGK